MTSIEFEDFLKSIGGLINCHNGKLIDYNLCSCGEGWFELIKSCIEELINAGWDKHVCQVKEKFGGLRFYISERNPEFLTIISKYEKLSYIICTECGEPGKLWSNRIWYQTLCDKCEEKKSEKRMV